VITSEIDINSGCINLKGQIWGPSTAPRIIALHGWLDNSESYNPLAKLLREYCILAPDLPGHGLSDHLPPNSIYSLETYALTLLFMIDKLGWNKFSIIGHSLGVGIGVLLAAAIPEKIVNFIMIDSLGPPTHTIDGHLEQFLLDMQSRNIFKFTNNQAYYKDYSEAIDIRRMISNISNKAAEFITKRDLLPTNKGFTSRCDRRLQYKSHRSLSEKYYNHLFRSIILPKLLIKATSGMLPDENYNERITCLKNLEIVEVEGQHHLHIDNAEVIADLISSFLSRNTSLTLL